MTEEYDPNYNGFANYENGQDYNPYSSLEGYNDGAATNGTDYASYSNSHSNETAATTSKHQDFKRRRDFDEGKLFIGGLSWDTTDDGLNEYFGQFGKMIDSVVMKDGAGKSRGFAFVTYEDPAVVRAVMAKESHVIDNKQVDPKPAIAREVQVKAEKMFVGSIPPSVSEADLTAYFTRFGKPMDVSLMIDHETGLSRGFAFVTFENDESLRSALNAGPHELGGSVLEVNKALPRRSGGGSFPPPSASSFPPSKRDHHYADEQRSSYASRDRGSGRRGSSGPDRSSRYKGPRNDYYSSGSDYATYPSSHYSSRSGGSTTTAAVASPPPPPHAAYAYPSPSQGYHGYPPYYYDPSSYYNYPQYDPSTGESSYASPSAGSGSYYPPPYPGYYAPPYPLPPPPSGATASASSESMMPEGKGSEGATNKSGSYPSYPPYYPPPSSHYPPYPPPHSHSHSLPPHASSSSYSSNNNSSSSSRGDGGGEHGYGNASRAPPAPHSRPYSNSGNYSGNHYGDRDRDRDRERDRDGKPNYNSHSKPHYHPYSKR